MLGRFFDATRAHIEACWRVHALGGMAVTAGMVVYGWGLFLLYLLLFGSTLLFGAIDRQELGMVVFFGLGALGSLLVACLHGLVLALWLGWLRIALRRQRGLPTGGWEVLWALRRPLRLLGLLGLVVLAVLLSATCLYLPLLLVGPGMVLGIVALCEDDLGFGAALARGWRLAGRAPGPLLVSSLLFGFCVGFLFVFPLVGPGLAAGLVSASAVAIYELLAREG